MVPSASVVAVMYTEDVAIQQGMDLCGSSKWVDVHIGVSPLMSGEAGEPIADAAMHADEVVIPQGVACLW